MNQMSNRAIANKTQWAEYTKSEREVQQRRSESKTLDLLMRAVAGGKCPHSNVYSTMPMDQTSAANMLVAVAVANGGSVVLLAGRFCNVNSSGAA
eukprot:m.205368 g.205368  ORF g.205368 m.205368 type:complete len:95 (+) comp15015_c0_seq3:1357-1641(+)